MTYPVVLVTTTDILENRRGELISLIDSLDMAETFVNNNQKQTVGILSELNGFDPDLVEVSMSLHRFELREPDDIRESIKTLSGILLYMNKVEKEPDWDKVLNNTLFR